MMRMLVVLGLLLPHLVSAQGLNAGFVQGLWYSKTPFFAGETVRIYTAIQNNSGFDIQGTVEFAVDGKNIGESSFSIVSGRIVEAWADWDITQGNHSVGANIKEVFKVEVGKSPEPISLGNTQLGVAQVFADKDTDQDELGDTEDTDDDNDLLADETEEQLGTDPLDADTDNDGLSDGKEVELGTNPLERDTDQDGISDATEVSQGSNPLVGELATKEHIEEASPQPAEDSLVVKAIEKLTQEYLPALLQQVDSAVQTATEKLQTQRQGLQKKREAFAAGESPEPLSAGEQSLDFLLASAIIALPQWQLGLFLFFAIAAALLLRRLKKEPSTKR